MDAPDREEESLKDEMRNLIEEARMLLPGIQALFGFQTIAVFSERFDDLSDMVKDCHLLALGLVVLAIGLVITPAAYHRIAEPGCVSRRAVRLSSEFICSALAPLGCGIALDMYVVINLATDSTLASGLAAAAAFVVLMVLWFVFPFHSRRRAQQSGNEKSPPA